LELKKLNFEYVVVPVSGGGCASGKCAHSLITLTHTHANFDHHSHP
jgi:hypothetical protein